MKRTEQRKLRKHERGSTAFEAVAVLVLLFFILFSMLQIYRWCMTRQICQYAAFYTAKAVALGYRPNLAIRAARVAAIPISGEPLGNISDTESSAENYMSYGDASGVNYQYWNRQNSDDEPYLEISGNYHQKIVAAYVCLRDMPLLAEGIFSLMLSLNKNPEPSASVHSFNYSKIYQEE